MTVKTVCLRLAACPFKPFFVRLCRHFMNCYRRMSTCFCNAGCRPAESSFSVPAFGASVPLRTSAFAVPVSPASAAAAVSASASSVSLEAFFSAVFPASGDHERLLLSRRPFFLLASSVLKLLCRPRQHFRELVVVKGLCQIVQGSHVKSLEHAVLQGADEDNHHISVV